MTTKEARMSVAAKGSFPVIEKGVPIPKRCLRAKYPFRWMAVGDSFLVPSGKLARVASSASEAGRRQGRKFVTRQDRDEMGRVRGIRVWRVA